jgi:hypothetical protein
MSRAIIDDNADPYALRDAIQASIEMLERHAPEVYGKHLPTLRSLMTQLRPRASESAVWYEHVSRGVMREHHAMRVIHLCESEGTEIWERYVWPEEAQAALAAHIREMHPKATDYVHHMSTIGITRRDHTSTGDTNAEG